MLMQSVLETLNSISYILSVYFTKAKSTHLQHIEMCNCIHETYTNYI